MNGHVSESGRVRHETFRPTSGDWTLDVRRYWRPDTLEATRRPILMIPGYAMNAFILGFHPTGRSMIEFLVDHGFEVWTGNLRGQGDSRAGSEAGDYGFHEIAGVDLPKVRHLVAEQTASERSRIDVIGCSLGATYVYAALALHAESHAVGSIVAIGGPLRWIDVHPAVRVAFASPAVAGALPSVGTRLMARLAIPIIKRLPALASLYMNVHQIELAEADELVKTVDDPNPRLNRQISRWIQNRDLEVDGRNVTRAMNDIHTPVLCVLANRDGIVPPTSALSILEAIGTDDSDVLHVGDDEHWFAHADLFISEHAEREVFAPMTDWLLARQ